jgi:hypothetical protein
MDAFLFEVLAPAAKRVLELEAVPDRKMLFVALYLALVIGNRLWIDGLNARPIDAASVAA